MIVLIQPLARARPPWRILGSTVQCLDLTPPVTHQNRVPHFLQNSAVLYGRKLTGNTTSWGLARLSSPSRTAFRTISRIWPQSAVLFPVAPLIWTSAI